MKDTQTVKVKGVSKKFIIRGTTKYGGVKRVSNKTALKNVSFESNAGEILGIIGNNGSGKSTLLKLISGLIIADSGEIDVNGKIVSILELGAGFKPDVSGYDNINMYCRLHGLQKTEIDERMETILKFSELGDYIYNPLNTYSSGMRAKLATAVICHLDFDILIIDEALSVGDPAFNLKCKNVFKKFKKDGKTIILTSHNMATIEELCDRVLWLEDGSIKNIGAPDEMCYKFSSEYSSSYDYLIEQANLGDSVSMNKLGVMYRDGISLEKDIEQSIYWFLRAAEAGNSDAQLNYASYLTDIGQIDEAKIYFQKSSESGNIIATTRLKMLSEKHNASIMNLIDELEQLANAGNIRASKLLADLYYNGNFCSKNYYRAFELFYYCAKKGDNEAKFIVGILYRDGIGVKADVKESTNWLIDAANNGNLSAKKELAKMYMRGIGVRRDVELAIYWLTQCANSGDLKSMETLGKIYGDSTTPYFDSDLADDWYTTYAVQQRATYELTFAEICTCTDGEYFKKRAEYWFNLGIQNCSPKILKKYLKIISTEKNMLQNTDEFINHMNRLIDAGDPSGHYYLSLLYLNERSDLFDIEKSFKYMLKSAEMGEFHAMTGLSYFLQKECVPPIKKELVNNLLNLASEYEPK